MNWLTLGLPLAATLLSVILIVATTASTSAMSFLVFIPVMLATYLASGIAFVIQKQEYKRALSQAREHYASELLTIHDRLDWLRQEEQRLRNEHDPDFDSCIAAAVNQDPRLGERRAADEDFTSVRLGIGEMRAAITIEAPGVDARPPEFSDHFAKIDQWVREYSRVERVPFLVTLGKIGGLAISGPRVDTTALTRSIICQLATHHWLTELSFAVVAKQDFLDEWAWVASLPQGRSWVKNVGGTDEDRNAATLVRLETELRKRQQVREAQQVKNDTAAPILPQLVVIVDHYPGTFSSPALMLLLEKGQGLGVLALFLVDETQQAPNNCSALLEFDYLSDEARLKYSETGVAGITGRCAPDQVSGQQAADFASALSKIEWRIVEDISQPPKQVSFLDMFGVNSLDELDIENWWDGNYRFGYLHAPIGKTSRDADLIFDLNDKDESHGPHGLIGGMPGSGKSELLRTIVLSFALTHHPNDLNFALIDYKGGATFNDLQNLPHTAGVVTDLETHAGYVERVILSLTGELKRREQILEQAKRTFGFEPAHIDKYRELAVKRPLPRLIVIFDEFAQFKLKHPEESKTLIEISRKGRSLGIHLILATQNLREAVDDVVRQNSNFLIALRVSEPADSTQLIGIPDAAFLTKGRAYFRVRSNSLFQAAFAGEKYRGMLLPEDAIIRILPNGKRQVVYPLNWKTLSVPADQPQITEAQAIIDLIQRTADRLGIEKLPSVWQDPLPDRPDLPSIQAKAERMNWEGATWKPSEYWPAPLLGSCDNPIEQNQFDFEFDPLEGGGHLIIFGSPGSGKSTLLRTIVTSLALGQSPYQVSIYIADLAGRPSLEIFRQLPHVGSVITQSESERVDRLVRMLREIGNTRSKLFAQAQVDDLRAYNQKVKEDARLPVIFVVIDDLGELKRNYLDQAKDLSTLLNSGRSLGISFIIAAISQNDLPTDAFNNIQTRITFNQADRSAYSSIVGYLPQARIESEFGSEIQPGRGLLRGNPPLLFQAALPTEGDNDDIQIRQLGEMVQAMHAAWRGKEPTLPIRILEPLVSLREILSPRIPNLPEAIQVVLGQDYESLAPTGFTLGDDGHLFLVAASGPKMGKTATLLTWAASMAEQYSRSDVRFLVFDFHKRSLGALERLPQTLVYVGRRNLLEAGLRELTSQVQQRREFARREDFSKSDQRPPTLIVFIDDYYTFTDECSDDEKKQLWDSLLNSKDLGMSLVFSSDVSEAMADYSDLLVKKVRAQGSGILISPKEGNDLYRYAKIPQIPVPLAFGPGRGWLIKRGQARLTQVAFCTEVSK